MPQRSSSAFSFLCILITPLSLYLSLSRRAGIRIISSKFFSVKAPQNRLSLYQATQSVIRKERGAIVATRNQVILSRILAGMRDKSGTKAKGRNSTNRNPTINYRPKARIK